MDNINANQQENCSDPLVYSNIRNGSFKNAELECMYNSCQYDGPNVKEQIKNFIFKTVSWEGGGG